MGTRPGEMPFISGMYDLHPRVSMGALKPHNENIPFSSMVRDGNRNARAMARDLATSGQRLEHAFNRVVSHASEEAIANLWMGGALTISEDVINVYRCHLHSQNCTMLHLHADTVWRLRDCMFQVRSQCRHREYRLRPA